MKASGRLAPPGRTTSETTTASNTTATNAANHGQARTVGRGDRAERRSPTRSQKVESSRPPSMIIPTSAGATRIRRNCARPQEREISVPGDRRSR